MAAAQTFEAAPFHADVADAPEAARALWVRAADGPRLRIALLGPAGAATGAPRGSVLILPGRTEVVEKYGPTARALAARGYAALAPDWRGQGLSDRLLQDRRIGHVARFDDYQHDVAALVRVADTLALPRPWHLLAHSMGGAIGLRACLRGLTVASAVFSAPMWGLALPPGRRVAVGALTALAGPLGLSARPVPSADGGILAVPFAENRLTSDAERYAWMQAQVRAHPDLGLGPPSLGWLRGALRTCRALARAPAPRLPALCLLGARERIVDTDAIRRRMATWPGGRLVIEPGAEHEPLMETHAIRARALAAACDHFDSHPG